MARMVRKQVYIEARQEALLKRRAKELGVSEAEVVRRGIDQVALVPAVELKAWGPERGRLWEELRTDMEERSKLQVPQTGRSWTREELYDERLARYSR